MNKHSTLFPARDLSELRNTQGSHQSNELHLLNLHIANTKD